MILAVGVITTFAGLAVVDFVLRNLLHALFELFVVALFIFALLTGGIVS